jgi:hypothetical protein
VSPSTASAAQTRIPWPPLLPREHGAWAMLIVPLAVGALTGGGLSWPVALTFVAAFFAYLARHPLVLLARSRGRRERAPATAGFWLAVYTLIAAAAGFTVIVLYRYWLLVPLAALAAALLAMNLYLASRRAEMTVGGELLGIAGLTLGAPAMYYVAAGAPGQQMLGLWLLSFLYFGGSVFYIKLKVRVHSRQAPPASMLQRLYAGRAAILYHLATLAVTIVLVATSLVPLLAPLAYVPVTCKAFQGTLDWRQSVKIRRLGMIELAHSVVFALLIVLAYH